jgi:hypothetical protein
VNPSASAAPTTEPCEATALKEVTAARSIMKQRYCVVGRYSRWCFTMSAATMAA